ncbi:hypothetical protein GGF40_000809 [Coemansia sp. RSA 1286]|nr:hypothetical protein GGF40_000809 [Coemansia sp. RSA 1286]
MVYSKAFIESAEMGVAGLDSIDQLHLLDNNLVSNFDIIVATNSSQFVKNIDIAIEDIVCLQALVYGRNLKHYLRTNSWANVASLKIKLAIRHVKHRTNPNYMVHFTHYLNGFCDTVVERVPGVVDIRVSVESRLQLCKNFGGLMLGAYSKQLKSLSCSTEILKGIVELPSQLTKLSITFVTGNRVDLPKLDVRVLEVLELIDAPPEFELVSLSNSEKRTSIEFSNLVSLNLICADALNPDVYFSYDFGYQNLSAGYFADRLASIRIDPISMFDFPQFSRDLVSLRIAATEETWLHAKRIRSEDRAH